MISSAKAWFYALSQREKILIAIMGILTALVVGYYAFVGPFIGAFETAEKRYQEAVDSRVQIETKVAALTAPTNQTANPVSGPLEVFISQHAGEAGFAIGRLDPQSDGSVKLSIDAAKPRALFGWLASMENRAISIDELAVNPGDNDTVIATMTLRSVKPN
ncbi:type II secretion system protein GspM [Sphingorhabdus sp. Alg231-15]|uniref:type II secretion system protein GspM n=1 Tax=Sphingorhabdus sp. Alg231-15 TaxID=1922222 RepID=UPI000D55BD30